MGFPFYPTCNFLDGPLLKLLILHPPHFDLNVDRPPCHMSINPIIIGL